MAQIFDIKDTKTNRLRWASRLRQLYKEAKSRHGGRSLTIYEDVSRMMNYLEYYEELPTDYDLFTECDRLADRLRNK